MTICVLLLSIRRTVSLKHKIYDILLYSRIVRMYNEILPGIYLGDHNSAQALDFLKCKNVKLIVNCTKDVFYDIHTNKIQVIRYTDINSDHLFLLIDQYLSKNKSVLFHCYAGLTRSATILSEYLVHKLNISHSYAKKMIKKKRMLSLYDDKKIE